MLKDPHESFYVSEPYKAAIGALRDVNRTDLTEVQTEQMGFILIGILIIIILIIFIGNRSGLFASVFGGRSNTQTEEQDNTDDSQDTADSEDLVEVPNLVGKTEDEARELLTSRGLGMSWQGDEVSDQPKGTISSQEIEAGTMVEMYSTINYKRSSGNPTVTIPSVIGRTQVEAQELLEESGFVVEVTQSYDTITTKSARLWQCLRKREPKRRPAPR